MNASIKMIADQIKLVDVIIYMLDARCPISCLNPKFEQMIERRPVLFVLNKADLAPNGVISKFRADLEKQIKPTIKYKIISYNSARSGGSGMVASAIEQLLADKINTSAGKGIKRTNRAIVIGVTNCGKSTFINNMASKGKTLTGDKPGVTRTKQWVSINDNLWLLDTPGTLWPSFENNQIAKNLAYVGSIKDDILNIIDLAKALLADLETLQPNCLTQRFGSSDFEQICRKRGYILKGGSLDEERAAKAILTEFRAGKLGRFNLDQLL
jgi:ribosome biogenesis GTPase A